ncbi:MAG: class I SAM-dependent methyltransferase [Pirellulales bacterium]
MQSAQFQLHAEIEDRHWWFVARRQILTDVIHAIVPPSPPATIVDVGCGTGANLAGLAEQYERIGIDTSADAIRLAKSRFPRVQFIHGLAPRDLGPIMDRAGLILLSDVLEHVPDDFELFSELLAAARPGAFFLITVPADLALWSEHDRAFGHYRRYDSARLEQLWQGLPARPVFISPFNARLYPIVKAIRGWNRLRHKSSGEAGTDFQMPGPLVNRTLERCFAGERHKLVRLARGDAVSPYRRGVSLIALIRREPGPFKPRRKPSHVASDYFDPAADQSTAVLSQ